MVVNERNIDALELLLAERWPRGRSSERFQSWLEVAMFLASHGVLAPSSLTDEEAADAHVHALLVSDEMPGETHDAYVARHVEWTAARLREALDLIAKGETAKQEADAAREEDRIRDAVKEIGEVFRLAHPELES